ncbi:MAG: arsenic transporter [Oscillospiraceae bacterium]|jgi:Na+/H+ antiporter NhaD/arsenite permease-like protein|nr:arsenic transporter [Oscillospiraceae bacterium]
MSEGTLKIVALALFALMYVGIIGFPKWKTWYALGVAAVYVILGILPAQKILGSINWNVLMMITGTMLIVYYFIESQMPNRIAELLLSKAKNVMWVTILMSLFSGIVSAFIDNVATVLMVAPVGIAICKKLNINPVGMILSIAVSSNLQGAATLVGDTTSIMLAGAANMDFLDFFWMEGRPGMFFAVELGAVATVPIMMILFRKDRQPVSSTDRTAVNDYVPSVMLILMVALLIAASFLPNKPETTNGLICMGLAVVTVVLDLVRHRGGKRFGAAVRSIDFETLFLLVGLFLVIAGITEIGIIGEFANWIVKVGGSNPFLLYTMIVWGSVLISAFVDNIPYVMTMLPVLAQVTASLGMEPYLFYFGLLCGATLGGNLTPVGASANIAGAGLLRKQGWEVRFKDFARIGIPFTLTAVAVGYLFIWVFWS